MSDLISRQAAIDALDESIKRCDKALSSFEISMKDEYAVKVEKASLKHYRDILENLPSVQPERKKGKWLLSDEQRREDTDNGNYLYFCSNCLRSDVHAKTQEVPYCWWCGADMRGEKDD